MWNTILSLFHKEKELKKTQPELIININYNPTKAEFNNQKKLNILKFISNYWVIISLFATLFGGSTVWQYLNKINQTSILPDIYSNPTILLTITIVFFFYLIILFIIHTFPYGLALYWEMDQFSFKRTWFGCPSILLFFIPNIFTIIAILTNIPYIVLLIINIIIISIGTWCIKKVANYTSDFFILTATITLLASLSNPLSYLYIKILLNWIYSDIKDIFAWISLALYLYAIFFAFKFTFDNNKKITNKWIIVIPPFMLSVFCMYFSFLLFPSFSSQLLRPIHFIEYSDDSAWYLINNNFQKTDGSQEISGIKQRDLNKITAYFINQKQLTIAIGKFCRNELPSDKINCAKANTPSARSNALYGYMAWNLGNIKVFCPHHVKFTDNATENKQSSKQCLLIDGKYLQILDDQYITSD